MIDKFASLSPFLQGFLPSRYLIVVAVHAVMAMVAYLLAFLLRFEYQLPPAQWEVFLRTLPLLLVARGVTFSCFHICGGLWRYVSMRDIVAILKAVTSGSLLFAAVVLALFGRGFPRSIFVLDCILCLALVGGGRLALRALRESSRRYRQARARRAIIVGAGDAGEHLAREIERNPALDYQVVGFIDDDPFKQRRRIHGIEVVGMVEHIPQICRTRAAQEILIAIPSATREQHRRIFQYSRQSGVPFKTVPALNELLQGRARIDHLQEVRPEDLLGREPVRLDVDRLRQELHGKRILVTGAAGSIGSALCRQLATFAPEMLLLFDRAESGLYFIDLELKRVHPGLKVIPVVGDILDRQQVEDVLRSYSPDLLYHAAAYKHVPLMQEHPLGAVENNVFGTEVVAATARAYGVKKFVLISTDKAVRPVGIMGMTKRIAEGLVQLFYDGPMIAVAVRFGNVLGSDGSVLPLFQRQIARGGPVTVTDPQASRYFMLLSEAAQLVLQAGAMGKGGEVFLLDMGEPVRIMELAQNLIRLSGLEPGKDIPIEVIGLRPGERLHEALVMENEELLPTKHEKVFMVRNHSLNSVAFRRDLEELRRLVVARDREGTVEQLQSMSTRY